MQTLNLYSNRFEKSFVYQNIDLDKLKAFLNKITKAEPLSELLITTYFNPINSINKNKSMVLRFRQRSKLDIDKDYKQPKRWILNGDGVMELKIKNKKTLITRKRGHSINIDLYKNKKGFVFVNVPWILKYDNRLEPNITRIAKRLTYENKLKDLRITLEHKPAFYPYSLSSRKRFTARLFEVSDIVKIDIKSTNRILFKKTVKTFDRFKNNIVQNNRESTTPYSKMIIESSKKDGSIFVENAGKEIEAKANIPTDINLVSLIKRIKVEIEKKGYYTLPKFDSNISSRGEYELSRTIMGYKEKGKLNEVVTIIRLSKEAKKIFGFITILKWKSNNLIKNKIMNRNVKYEYLNETVSDQTVMKKISIKNRKIIVLGVLKKLKYRIAIQDKNKRCWIVSLDKTQSLQNKKFMKQLEVEYCWTEKSSKPKISLEQGCIKCINQIIKIIEGIENIKLNKTNLRKVDLFHA